MMGTHIRDVYVCFIEGNGLRHADRLSYVPHENDLLLLDRGVHRSQTVKVLRVVRHHEIREHRQVCHLVEVVVEELYPSGGK